MKENYDKKFINEYQRLIESKDKEIKNEEEQKFKEKEIEINRCHNKIIVYELNEKISSIEQEKFKYEEEMKNYLKQEVEYLKTQHENQQKVILIVNLNH